MATTIDNNWFNTGPGSGLTAPFVLSTDNEVYTLGADVFQSGSYGGEVFKLTGKNQQLNLNGHFIYYNSFRMPQACDSSVKEQRVPLKRPVSANVIKDLGGKFNVSGSDNFTAINVDAFNKDELGK